MSRSIYDEISELIDKYILWNIIIDNIYYNLVLN